MRWTTLQFDEGKVKSNIELPDFPVPDTDYRSFYLGDNDTLLDSAPSSGIKTYNSEDRWSIAKFRYTFDKHTRIIGMPKAELYMSCDDLDDMVVFVQVRKLDKNGKELSHLQFPIEKTPVKSVDAMDEKDRSSLTLHNGAMGILRASQRKIDEKRSIHPQFPFHPHDEVQKIPKGEVVRLVAYDRGRVADEYLSVPEYYGPLPPGDAIAMRANPTLLGRLTGAKPAEIRATARTADSAAELPPAPELMGEIARTLGIEGVGLSAEEAAAIEGAVTVEHS